MTFGFTYTISSLYLFLIILLLSILAIMGLTSPNFKQYMETGATTFMHQLYNFYLLITVLLALLSLTTLCYIKSRPSNKSSQVLMLRDNKATMRHQLRAFLDSGSNEHTTFISNEVDQKRRKPEFLKTAGGLTQAIRVGTQNYSVLVKGDTPLRVTLSDVVYLPKIDKHLWSLSKLVSGGCEITFGESPKLKFPEGTEVPVLEENGLYYICLLYTSPSPRD